MRANYIIITGVTLKYSIIHNLRAYHIIYIVFLLLKIYIQVLPYGHYNTTKAL